MSTPIDGVRRKHPIYTAWRHMKERCDNPNTKDAKNYHLRGIGYPEKWKSFDGFYQDMAQTYQRGLTLDRIDNDMGYSRENCRWATRTQQNNNTRKNRHFTINGETKTLSQWVLLSPNKPSTVRQRYYCYGWTIEKALGI